MTSTSRRRPSSSRPSRSSDSKSGRRPGPALAAAPMRVRLRVRQVILGMVGVLACAVPPTAVAAPSLDEVVSALEQAQQRVTDLKAPFGQTSYNRALNQTLEARGTL